MKLIFDSSCIVIIIIIIVAWFFLMVAMAGYGRQTTSFMDNSIEAGILLELAMVCGLALVTPRPSSLLPGVGKGAPAPPE